HRRRTQSYFPKRGDSICRSALRIRRERPAWQGRFARPDSTRKRESFHLTTRVSVWNPTAAAPLRGAPPNLPRRASVTLRLCGKHSWIRSQRDSVLQSKILWLLKRLTHTILEIASRLPRCARRPRRCGLSCL